MPSQEKGNASTPPELARLPLVVKGEGNPRSLTEKLLNAVREKGLKREHFYALRISGFGTEHGSRR